jgi:prolipoprotein diacylglyceryltransferase
MIPYFPQPVWRLGPFEIHAFGVAVAAAIISGYCLVLRRSRKYGIDATHAGTIFIVVSLVALAGGLLAGGGRSASATGFAAAGGAALLVCGWRERSWNLLDLIGGAVPLIYCVFRIGCFFAHDHVGRPTTSWLGVQFPGGTRFDLGLLHAMSAAGVTLAIEWIGRTDPPPGLVFGAMVSLMALTRFVVLRFADPINLADEIFASLMFIAGCQLVTARRRGRNPGSPATRID